MAPTLALSQTGEKLLGFAVLFAAIIIVLRVATRIVTGSWPTVTTTALALFVSAICAALSYGSKMKAKDSETVLGAALGIIAVQVGTYHWLLKVDYNSDITRWQALWIVLLQYVGTFILAFLLASVTGHPEYNWLLQDPP